MFISWCLSPKSSQLLLCLFFQSFVTLHPYGLGPSRLLCPWGFSRQEDSSGLPCPPPGDLPIPGIELRSPVLQVDSLLSESPEAQGYWSRQPIPSTGDLPDPGIKRVSCTAGRFFTSWVSREALSALDHSFKQTLGSRLFVFVFSFLFLSSLVTNILRCVNVDKALHCVQWMLNNSDYCLY